MKIYINATGPNGSGGYFTYVTNIVKNLVHINTSNDYHVLCNGDIYKELKFLNDDINLIRATSLHKFGIFRLLWMQLFLPFKLIFSYYDVCLFPLNASPYLSKFF
jgi:hypothetical protein